LVTSENITGVVNITKNEIPPGFKLLYRLSDQRYAPIDQISWSPDGTKLAAVSILQEVTIWDMETGSLIPSKSHSDHDLDSIPWNAKRSKLKHRFVLYPNNIICQVNFDIDFSSILNSSGIVDRLDVTAIDESEFNYEYVPNLTKVRNFFEHNEISAGVAYASSLYNRTFASTVFDKRTINLFHITKIYPQSSCHHFRDLEGHTDCITSLSFSFDGKLLASRSFDNVIRIWDCDKWETIAIIQDSNFFGSKQTISFNPKKYILASIVGRVVDIWELDPDMRICDTSNPQLSEKSFHYANAKVVLVGDSGVGKSGLGLVLTGQPFQPTESTHGRRVWTLDKQELELDGGQKETRETILWDLAGQPGYRLIHQLHLNELAAALVLFDARSETDPFAGVRHWDRALSQAQRVQGESALPMKKFLVAARTDRGRISVSRARIEALSHEMGFDAYFETSAKEGWNIPELAEAIRRSIDWDSLPKVTSTELFQRIKEFFINEKETGRVLSEVDDLYRLLLTKYVDLVDSEKLRAQFETCIGRVESRGLIRRLSFGDLLLLQPELLDTYASALVNEAKNEPDGQGCIAEEVALSGHFSMSEDERIKDKKQEKLLLIATIEEMLSHEIALREPADDGSYLVFPSQFTRENPDLPDPEGKAVIFTFEGAINNVYATLAVRISHSGLFTIDEMWKNAATYNATVGGKCGIFLREIEEGRGELALFFDTRASEETRFQFEEYIKAHLQRRALSESIRRRRIFVCPECATPLTELQVIRRRERGHDWIECNVCSERVSLLDSKERLKSIQPSAILEMDLAADIQRERETAASTIQGKIETDDFDVFLCHNSKDKEEVKKIGIKLKEIGLLPWLDEWELQPGLPWQPALEEKIERIKSAAVFVGVEGIGPWQRREIDALLREFVRRECPVIPTLLSDVPKKPELPVFLKGMTWIDFNKSDPDPIQQLIWGITGKKGFNLTC